MLMALAGITAAFVVISIVFIGAMLYLNNPLEKVPDVQVPDFKGLKYDAVTKAEEYSSFTFEVEDNQYNDLYERGAIISQKPKEGTKVKPNSVVRVVVSNGTKVVKMPNLIGLEETEAYYQLAELDLEYQKVEIFSDQTPGTVVGTEPGYDSEIPASTVVKVQISMGPENKIVEVPTSRERASTPPAPHWRSLVWRSAASAMCRVTKRGTSFFRRIPRRPLRCQREALSTLMSRPEKGSRT